MNLRVFVPMFVFAAIIIAGCGGGGSGAPIPTTPNPGPSATISPGPSPQTVTLAGGGYTLSFTLPAVTVGSTATVTASLQTAAPSGVPTPLLRQRSTTTSPPKGPNALGVPVNALVYLIVTSTAQIGFSNAPTFVFAMPAGTTVPAGSSAYLIYYDPTASIGWVNLLGPGTVAGQTVTFPGVATGVTFKANTPYVFALAVTTQPVPTAPPQPTPTASPIPTTAPGTTPTPAPTPTGVAGTFPLTVVNNNTAVMASSNITLYIYGQSPTSPNVFEGVNADGSTYQLLTTGSSVKPIAWLGGGGNAETVYLPPLIGARVYIVDGSSLNSLFTVPAYPVPAPSPGLIGPPGPAPWTNDGSQHVYFDDIEYAETSATNVNFDLSQTDALGLDLQVSATNGSGTQTIGLKPGAIKALAAALNGLSTPSPWNTLANDMPQHIMNPQHGSPNFFPSATFLDNAIMNAWGTYANGNWMEITAASLSATTYPGALYGTEDANGNLNFYAVQSIAGTLVGSIANPATYASAHNTTVTQEVLAQNGTFGDFSTPNTSYPSLGPAIGNRVSGALNSGVFVPNPMPSTQPISVQPVCTGRFTSGGSAYQNQYANLLHSVANTYAYVAGAAYGYPYDDLCGTSTDTTSNGIQSMTVTINPS